MILIKDNKDCRTIQKSRIILELDWAGWLASYRLSLYVSCRLLSSASSLLGRLAVRSLNFLLAVNFTNNSSTLATTKSRGSIAPLWIHLGMVVLACLNPSRSRTQLMWGLNWPLTVERRRRWGSSSQHTHSNCLPWWPLPPLSGEAEPEGEGEGEMGWGSGLTDGEGRS